MSPGRVIQDFQCCKNIISNIRVLFKMPLNYAVNRRERFIWYHNWLYYKTLKLPTLIKQLQYCSSVGSFIMALRANVRFKKNWLECHSYHHLLLKEQFPNTLLLGDSIIAGVLRYSKVCQKYFTTSKLMNHNM